MNATSLYVSTCRLILQAKVEDSSSWLDLYKLFPCLRQSLSCTVCGNLLIEPYTPTESNCQHHVCRSCKGGRKKLKPSCSWCKDYSKYVENVQLRTLLQCYKKLCQYVTSSEIYRTLSTLPSSSNNGSVDNNQLVEIIKEGTGFKDDFKTTTNTFILPVNANLNSYTSTSTQTVNITDGQQPEENVNDVSKDSLKTSPSVQNGISPLYSVYAASGNRLTLKRTDEAATNGDQADGIKGGVSGKTGKVRKRTQGGIVGRCECGLHVTTVRSTCRGYRCPCYSVDRPCLSCLCRGCNNPLGANPREDEGSEERTRRSLEIPHSNRL